MDCVFPSEDIIRASQSLQDSVLNDIGYIEGQPILQLLSIEPIAELPAGGKMDNFTTGKTKLGTHNILQSSRADHTPGSENINESYDMIFKEVSETGDPAFQIIDLDKNQTHTFYPQDYKKIIKFLKKLESLTLQFWLKNLYGKE